MVTYNDIMYAKKIIAALAISAILAVTMTMPGPLQQSLVGEITDKGESPLLARIGVVTDIAEADNITVEISGSNVLVTASYLFPQYQPVLGDRVYVTKQDAQWFVLGTTSGLPLNTQVANPSFEIGTLGTLPDDWTINVISSAGGPPTFTSIVNINSIISGQRAGDFGVDATGVGVSQAEILSTPIPASPGSVWTAAFHMPGVNFFGSVDGTLQAGIQFLDAGGGSLSITDFDNLYVTAGFPAPMYRRPNLNNGQQRFIAPAGTATVRLNLLGIFNMNLATGFISFYLDYMILRQVG